MAVSLASGDSPERPPYCLSLSTQRLGMTGFADRARYISIQRFTETMSSLTAPSTQRLTQKQCHHLLSNQHQETRQDNLLIGCPLVGQCHHWLSPWHLKTCMDNLFTVCSREPKDTSKEAPNWTYQFYPPISAPSIHRLVRTISRLTVPRERKTRQGPFSISFPACLS